MRARGLFILALLLPLQGCTFLEKAQDVATEGLAVAVPAAAGATLGPGWAALGAILGQFGYKIVDAEIDLEAMQKENQDLRAMLAGAQIQVETAGFFARWWKAILAACGGAVVLAYFSRSPVEGFRKPHPRQEQRVRDSAHREAQNVFRAAAAPPWIRQEAPPVES